MPAFIADHTGALRLRSKFLRPVHIGAALCDEKDRGPEPDLWEHSISAKTSYADLRLWHYLGALDFADDTPIAILQYRRMFFIGEPTFWNGGRALKEHAQSVWGNEAFQTHKSDNLRPAYVRWLSKRSDSTLNAMLADATLIANEAYFPKHTLQTQYKQSIAELYPGEKAYLTAWDDMRDILEARFGQESVAASFDGKRGYVNNVMIGRAKDVLAYRRFLFEVLDELSAYQDLFRIYGYLAERLQSAWVDYQVQQNGFRVRPASVMLFGEPVK